MRVRGRGGGCVWVTIGCQEIVDEIQKAGKAVLMCGLRPVIYALLSRQPWFNKARARARARARVGLMGFGGRRA